MNKLNINGWFVVSLILLAMLIWVTDAPTQGQTRKFMVIRDGALGMNFECLDNLPYSIDHTMVWDPERGATELDHYGNLEFQVIEVRDCNLDNIYSYDGRYYAWLFTSQNSDQHPTHRHLTRGAWWVNVNASEYGG